MNTYDKINMTLLFLVMALLSWNQYRMARRLEKVHELLLKQEFRNLDRKP